MAEEEMSEERHLTIPTLKMEDSAPRKRKKDSELKVCPEEFGGSRKETEAADERGEMAVSPGFTEEAVNELIQRAERHALQVTGERSDQPPDNSQDWQQ